ncbi:PrgI family protein (plasmid) [Paenibacillus thiaminolyticus]|uniref:PrgI family mobile element protein n=1 Tax=Paenibacillus thiaminolyticus TaxID=49283 RepID=UPI0023300E2E|nr:PrgI family protein [Paenibacillus thiaminolyticus]WCF11724.1 PrgI family protein [Paenibacillus thiaminolyticus]
MRVYQVPPDMNEKEKIIGGILNLNQFFWVLGGLILGAIVFAITFPLFGGGFSLFLGFLFCLSGVPFAVYKKNGLTLYEYLTYKRKFKKKVQKLPNIRKEVKF